MNKTKLLIIMLCFSLMDCFQHPDVEKSNLIVANTDLLEQIQNYIEHTDSVDGDRKNFDVTYHVMYQEVNDSTEHFVVMANSVPEWHRQHPHQCIVVVGGRKVFVHVAWWKEKAGYLQMTDSCFEKILKECYPTEYKAMNRENSFSMVTYEPELLYLRFVNGHLTEKALGRGLPTEQVFPM